MLSSPWPINENGKGILYSQPLLRDLLSLGVDTILVGRTTNSLALPVAVEENVTLILDELAFVVAVPECLEALGIIIVVVFANECLEVLSSLRAVVERHLGEEVVDDVEVSDVVEEESSLPTENGSVNGSSSTTLEVPFLSAVVGHDGVGVVEVSNHDEPVRNTEPRETVVFDSISSSEGVARVGDTPDHGGDTNVGHDDSIALGLGEEDGVGIEVVGPFRVGLLARDVEEKVSRESEDLLTDQHVQGVDGGVAQEFIVVESRITLLWKAEVGTSLRYINFITFHRGMVAVVAVVGDLPAEIRSPEEGMCDESNDVVHPFVIREGTVAALVTDNPDTREDEALEPPVGTPSGPTPNFSADGGEKFLRRSLLEVRVDVRSQGPGKGRQDNVPSEEPQAACSITNEESVGDGSTNLFQRPGHRGERGEFILVVFLDVCRGTHVLQQRRREVE